MRKGLIYLFWAVDLAVSIGVVWHVGGAWNYRNAKYNLAKDSAPATIVWLNHKDDVHGYSVDVPDYVDLVSRHPFWVYAASSKRFKEDYYNQLYVQDFENIARVSNCLQGSFGGQGTQVQYLICEGNKAVPLWGAKIASADRIAFLKSGDCDFVPRDATCLVSQADVKKLLASFKFTKHSNELNLEGWSDLGR